MITMSDLQKYGSYLGDGVYALKMDSYHVWLVTTDGLTITNQIALDPSVVEGLKKYLTS